jgi:hypothetical protein
VLIPKLRKARYRPGRMAEPPGLLDREPIREERIARLKALRPVAEALVAGALANRDIQGFFRDPHLGRFWTEAGQRRSPTVRVEYEHTVVIGHLGESLAIGHSKNWGRVVGVFPLRPDDPVDPYRMLYAFRRSNPYQRRFDQRVALRQALGPAFAPLVNRALRAGQGAFRAHLTDREITALRQVLGMDPAAIWRAVRGKARIAVPRQREMFEDEEGGGPQTMPP